MELVSPLTAFVLNSVIGQGEAYVFFIEAAGIWAFAAYWLVKSSEFKKSNATKRALRGEVETSPKGTAIAAAANAALPPDTSTAG